MTVAIFTGFIAIRLVFTRQNALPRGLVSSGTDREPGTGATTFSAHNPLTPIHREYSRLPPSSFLKARSLRSLTQNHQLA